MIGERLLDLRKDAGLTQDELSEILHVNKHSISSYEREKSEPPDTVKMAIARYFNVSVDYLLGLTDNPAPYADQCSVLRLPSRLPEGARRSLRDYVDFLAQKYTQDK